MPDVPVPRAFRADRRLISTITDNPQLIRYLENLGIDASTTIPDTFGEFLSLIIDAAESAYSAQGAANRSAQEAKENALIIQSLDIPSAARINDLWRLFNELNDRIDTPSDQRITALQRKVDELEAIIGEISRPSLDVYSGLIGPALFTPTLTFATPGNLAVTYANRSGTISKVGRQVFGNFFIATSAFTWTTASGALLITGLPYVNGAVDAMSFVCDFSGITKAGYTQMTAGVVAGGQTLAIVANGSGVTRTNVVAADVPSGGTVVLSGTFSYFV